MRRERQYNTHKSVKIEGQFILAGARAKFSFALLAWRNPTDKLIGISPSLRWRCVYLFIYLYRC